MWKQVLGLFALASVLTLAACPGNTQTKPTGTDGGTTADQPVTSESQPSH